MRGPMTAGKVLSCALGLAVCAGDTKIVNADLATARA